MKLIQLILGLIIGLLIGYLGKNIIDTKLLNIPFEERLSAIIGYTFQASFMPVDPKPTRTVTSSLKIAHENSVRFRTNLNNNYCTFLPSGMIAVDPKTLGLMDLSYNNANDIVASMQKIRKSFPGTRPENFRLINAITSNNESKLMVVALNASGTEITSSPIENEPIIYVLDNPIDCPIRCDYTKSEIIQGSSKDPCK